MRKPERGREGQGYTLAETLLTVLILLMVSGIVATGVPVAKNIYEKVVLGANAQVLLSNAVTSLRYELGTAMNVQIEGTSLTYTSAHSGMRSQIFLGGTGTEGEQSGHSVSEGIVLSEFDGQSVKRLVSRGAGGTNNTRGNMFVFYESVTREEDRLVFHDLTVYYHLGGDSAGFAETLSSSSRLAELPEFSVRVIGSFAEP